MADSSPVDLRQVMPDLSSVFLSDGTTDCRLRIPREYQEARYSWLPHGRRSSGNRTLRNCAIVGHVHDELIIECAPDVSLDAICEQMGRIPPWIPGLKLRADGDKCGFYMKN